MPTKSNISQFLLTRLHQLGVKHLFGVCGDVVLGFMEQITKSPIQQINCCNELNAGYAADGYARLNGIGCVVTTFTVGPLSAINAIGGAFAENVPVVIIGGAPERKYAKTGRMLHHTLGADYSVAREMFKNITVAYEYLEDPAKIPEQIDSALAKCLFFKKPIYIEIPADLVVHPCVNAKPFQKINFASDEKALLEAQTEIVTMLNKAKNPVILLGMEIHRHGLQAVVKKIITKTNIPFCTFPTAKSVLSETMPQFLGMYQGEWSRDAVKKRVENADCILMLGAYLIDSDTGGFTAKLNREKLIQANFLNTQVKYHDYPNILLADLLERLAAKLAPKKSAKISKPKELSSQLNAEPKKDGRITINYFFKRVSSFIQENDVIVCDVGESLYSVSTLIFPKNVRFIAQSFYNSIGYSVGAALGAATENKNRTLLFVGDGSFQIGAQELSTMIQQKCHTVVFLINNDGYGIERAIYDGPYNDLSQWKYHLLPLVFNGAPGWLVETESQLEEALAYAENAKHLTFIEIKVGRFDFGETLKRAGAAMAKSSKNSYE